MGRQGIQHYGKVLQAFLVKAANGVQLVGELHQGGDGGVELELVEVPEDVGARPGECAAGRGRGMAVDGHGEDAVHPAGDADDVLLVPVQVALHRRLEEDGQSEAVRAVYVQKLRGVDAVVFAFAHLFPGHQRLPSRGLYYHTAHTAIGRVGEFVGFQVGVRVGAAERPPHDEALAEEALEGLTWAPGLEVVHEELVDEARVQQMQDGVFHAADVNVHGHPRELLGVECTGAVVGIQEAQKVPRGIDKGVHRIRFRLNVVFTAALMAFRIAIGQVVPLIVDCEDGAARGAMQDGDGRAPAALAGDEPVAHLRDPVALHLLDAVGPLREGVQAGEELRGVGGDFEEPLGKQPALDEGAAAPGAALGGHLLVGQHRLVLRVPVHFGVRAVRKALPEQAGKEPARPAGVRGVARVDLALVPGDLDAEVHNLALHLRNVRARPVGGVDAALAGGVLGGQAKGVPAERVQHAAALQALHARERVGDRVHPDVAHVQTPRGIGKLREHVELFSPITASCVQDLLAPLALNRFNQSGEAPPLPH